MLSRLDAIPQKKVMQEEVSQNENNKFMNVFGQINQREKTQSNNDSKKVLNLQPEWKSENSLVHSVQGKNKLASLLLSFQLHQMGFYYPEYQKQINNFVDESNIEMVPLNSLNYWVKKNKNTMINFLLPQKKSQQSRFAHRSLSSILPTNQEDSNNISEDINSQEIICPICLSVSKDYQKRGCKHNFCNECIRMHILECMSSGDYELKCPMEECETQIDGSLIRKLLTNSQYQKLKYFKYKNMLEKNPQNKFCSKVDCGELLQETRQGELRCPSCESIFCRICLQSSHSPSPCNETLEKALKQTKCPKCSAPIQKIDGCNHIVCKRCRIQFCWICLRECSIHHYRYYNCWGCPGLQFGDSEQLPSHKSFSPLLFILMVLGFFIGLPLYMIYCLFCQPCDWVEQQATLCEVQLLKKTKCCHEYVKTLLYYLLLFPRSLVYALFQSPIKFVYFCFNALIE